MPRRILDIFNEKIPLLDRSYDFPEVDMNEVRWEFYPLVAQTTTARTWLELQQRLQLAPKTIDAYGRGLNDFLAFCGKHEISPTTITREHVAMYVQDLAHRPNPKSKQSLTVDAPPGLSNSTLQ